MSLNRVTIVEQNLDEALAAARPAAQLLGLDDPLRPGSTLTVRVARRLFEDAYLSRSLDVAARELKREGKSFYTISSAGHERNALLGAQLRTTDPCFLHYRSGGLMMARSRQLTGSTPAFDTLLSLCASSEDPASNGRHKVWGSREGWVPPQTSTIASHLPKAVGTAFALQRARRLRVDTNLPADAIVCCTFGDASVNHATALAGINSARYAKRRDNPAPILFVCEDNQRGISVETPRRWIRDFFSNMPHMRFFEAKGELEEAWGNIELAIQTCRTTRGPVFLRLSCVRLWGHAGSDVEEAYRSLAEIEAVEARDPVLLDALHLIELGAATPTQLQAVIAQTRDRVRAAGQEASSRSRLSSVEEIVAPLAPYDEPLVRAAALAPIPAEARREVFGPNLPEEATAAGRRTLAAHVNSALHDEMIRRGEVIVFGEDVGKKGGVYGVTQHLQERFGNARCFDTLLDETTILGVAQGAAQVGLLPVPEIPYLAYLHNAIDQLRGEACSLSFFSNGRYTNPMVVRIAGLAYQKGFGGHFHNDNSLGALREIPGLAIACPARGDDAARLLRGAVALARQCGRVVTFLEPIALYHERDLYEAGDGEWLTDYPVPDGSEDSALFPGQVGTYGPEDAPLLIVTYGNGVRLSLRAARRIEEATGRSVRVLDLRWLAPLPHAAVRAAAEAAERVLIVDECRATQAGVADALVARLVEGAPHSPAREASAEALEPPYRGPLATVRAVDSFVPLGPAADVVLVSVDDIVRGAERVLAQPMARSEVRS